MTAVAVDRPAAPSLLALTAVELRKMTDTRAGRWLLASVVLIGAALVGVVLFAVPRAELTMEELFGAATSGASAAFGSRAVRPAGSPSIVRSSSVTRPTLPPTAPLDCTPARGGRRWPAPRARTSSRRRRR